MGAEDEQRRLEIRNERLHRLRLLELRQARQGNDTPPEVLIEIASTRRELGMAELLVQASVSQEFAAELGSDNQFAIIMHLFEESRRQQATRAQMTDERFDRVEEVQHLRLSEQDSKRHYGQLRTIAVLVVFTIVLGVNIYLTLMIAATLRAHGL